MLNYIKLMRPKHWVKNAFVLAPLMFSKKIVELAPLEHSLIAFVAFSLAASLVYIINDIADAEKDKAHPQKKNRPIASGAISKQKASMLGIALIIINAVIMSCLPLMSVFIIIAYFIMNLAYSIRLKHIMLFDVFIIAFGFILRVYAGAYAILVPVSHWIFLATFFISLFLGFGKRRNELFVLSEDKIKHRPVLKNYNETLLDFFIMISATLTIITYTFYTIDDDTVAKFGTNNLIYTLPMVTYGMFRYLYIM